jgi:hypothetical protein
MCGLQVLFARSSYVDQGVFDLPYATEYIKLQLLIFQYKELQILMEHQLIMLMK